MKRTPLASHVRSSSVCSESLVAVRPDRSSSCEYFTSRGESGGTKRGWGGGHREREGESLLALNQFLGKMNNLKNHSPEGIYGRRQGEGEMFAESGSGVDGMPKGLSGGGRRSDGGD